MKKYIPTLIFLLAYQLLDAQDASFMYGIVYTEDGKTFEGPIRWGKEEVYWTDVFNASKERNENLRYLTTDQREHLDDRQFRNDDWGNRIARSFGVNWSDEGRDYYHAYVHQFSCQFGEIKTLRPEGSSSAELELRSGVKIEVDGEGYNDVGEDIKVLDKELGEVDVHWTRIDRVEFTEAPAKLALRFGSPLYGIVKAFGETFTGFIQWDHDERLSVDKLDGDSDDGDMSIEFGKIKSIERTGNRSRVTLKSGREITLDGSNDVSSGHRGVIVMNNEFASIDIPWSEFDKVTFQDKPGQPLPTFGSFIAQKELSGSVTGYDGKVYSGRIVYDLDEAYDHELLQGKEGEFEYAMPFRNISSLTTDGEYQCSITLKSGRKITLGDGQDVDEHNQGILVFENGKSDPTYISWQDVREITFK